MGREDPREGTERHEYHLFLSHHLKPSSGILLGPGRLPFSTKGSGNDEFQGQGSLSQSPNSEPLC